MAGLPPQGPAESRLGTSPALFQLSVLTASLGHNAGGVGSCLGLWRSRHPWLWLPASGSVWGGGSSGHRRCWPAGTSHQQVDGSPGLNPVLSRAWHQCHRAEPGPRIRKHTYKCEHVCTCVCACKCACVKSLWRGEPGRAATLTYLDAAGPLLGLLGQQTLASPAPGLGPRPHPRASFPPCLLNSLLPGEGSLPADPTDDSEGVERKWPTLVETEARRGWPAQGHVAGGRHGWAGTWVPLLLARAG